MAVHRSAEYWSLGIDFLAAGNYIAVNRSLIRVFGLEGAVLIGELVFTWVMEGYGREQDGASKRD